VTGAPKPQAPRIGPPVRSLMSLNLRETLTRRTERSPRRWLADSWESHTGRSHSRAAPHQIPPRVHPNAFGLRFALLLPSLVLTDRSRDVTSIELHPIDGARRIV
jgi:hypothetical protein